MIRVLHIVSALDSGGVENLLLNYYTHMNKDNFIFDFVVHGEKIGALEPVFNGMNSRIFHIPSKHESFIKNLNSMKRIIYNGNYDVVHVHQGIISVFPIYFAKKKGISIRITHNHLAFKPENFIEKLINRLLLIPLKRYSTNWFACGIDAGISLWGCKAVKEGKVHIMKNAIDIDKFAFNPQIRDEMRRKLNLEKKFVIGNVARLSYQKNHEFIIRVFNEIYKANKNAVLLLVGRGELENEVKEQVQNLGLTEVVKFLGVRNDVPELLQAMDIFLLPSRYEGLPVVLVESQAAGLKSFAADTITTEVKCTDLLEYISLKESPKYWANEILKYKDGYVRKNTFEKIKDGGYDIKKEVLTLEKIYSRGFVDRGKENECNESK